MGQSQPLLVYFCYFLDTISIVQIEKSVDGVLGIQTRGCRMVGADKTTVLWRPRNSILSTQLKLPEDLAVVVVKLSACQPFAPVIQVQIPL